MVTSILSDPFFIRNFVYGFEDSLISTTGVLIGVTFAGFELPYIIVSGLILIIVEALSMAFGTFISEESFLITLRKQYTTLHILFYAFVMFISYFAAGILVLLPYLLRLQYNYVYSIVIALVCLFIVILFVQKKVIKAILITVFGGVLLALTIASGKILNLQMHNYSRNQ